MIMLAVVKTIKVWRPVAKMLMLHLLLHDLSYVSKKALLCWEESPDLSFLKDWQTVLSGRLHESKR